MNKFEWVNGKQHEKLPVRSTKNSAGYDFFAHTGFVVPARGKTDLLFSDVKVQLDSDSVLLLFPRSSLGCKGIRLANTVGVIDSDYYGNPKNDGNIGFVLVNDSDADIVISAGDKFMQGIIIKYGVTVDDDSNTERKGGFGSTN